jgi:hypothetical protein
VTPRESDTIISAAAGTSEGNQELRSRSELTAKEVMREIVYICLKNEPAHSTNDLGCS